MKKTVAIPQRLNKPFNDLTEDEQAELANYGDFDLTTEEVAEREAEELAQKTIAQSDFIRTYCKELEAAGTSYGQIPIATDERSLLLIAGAVSRALVDNDLTKEYEYYPPGLPAIEITNAAFIAIGLAQATHIQKVGSIKNAVQLKQESGDYVDIDAIKADIDERMEV